VPARPDAAAWRGRRVLVTGHTGFKGAWLSLYLAHLGAEVHGLAGPPPTTPSLYGLARVRETLESERRVDVTDARAVQDAVQDVGAEVVLHLAAQAIVRRSLSDPAATWAVNVVGTANLLQALPESTRAVVVVTSDKCYRDVESGRPMREDDALGGKDPYSASKAAQELVAASFRELRDLPLATARAGNVIGGGDWAADRLVPDLVRAAEAAIPLVLRNPDAIRPWQHVLNPLSGYLVLAQALLGDEPVREAFNFGPAAEDARPVGWLVERLAKRWPGHAPQVRIEPDPDAARESALLRLDSAKARERLGWTPTWGIEEGLDATAGWYATGDARERCGGQIARFHQGP
jgi:CDP-glucose 4,6-dehydratase